MKYLKRFEEINNENLPNGWTRIRPNINGTEKYINKEHSMGLLFTKK